MSPLAKKIQWVIALVIADAPRALRSRDIERTTGLPHRAVEDAIYDLVQCGRVRICPDSTLEIT